MSEDDPSSQQPDTTEEERQKKTALTELSSLGRVSHRLALVDSTERLQQVLEKLLPRLLKRVGDNHREQMNATGNLRNTHDQIHAKLVEMLSHAMKRVRDDQNCKLPCQDVMKLLLVEEEGEKFGEEEGAVGGVDGQHKNRQGIPRGKCSVDPFTLNLALAFLTLGIPRCKTRHEIEELLPGLFVLVGHYSGLAAIRTAARKSQSQQVAHLLLRAVEWLVQEENSLATPKFGVKNTKTATTNSTDDSSSAIFTKQDTMDLVREVCRRDSRAAGAVFDLLLDGLLYQPVAGNVPPNGLSQAGHERLKAGSSTIARDWAAEKAPRMRLMEFKLAILDFVAPSRRWAVFMGKSNKNRMFENDDYTNISRTVALLVVASGDPNIEVSQRANTYLKIHHDSFRGSSNEPNSSNDASSIGPASPISATNAVGDTVVLTCGLLSLALGQTYAESALGRIATASGDTAETNKLWLGLPPERPDPSDSSQLLLSLKRRAASEATSATVMDYIADKILEENPQLLQDGGIIKVQQLVTLPLLVAQRTLSNLRTASGLSVLQAKAYVAAAKLLNMLCIRLSSCYDSLFWMAEGIEEKKEETRQESDDVSDRIILHLLARALSTACSVLAPASAKSGASTVITAVSNEGNLAVRDACYGVVCSLSRSRFALATESYIFTRGNTDAKVSKGVVKVSIDTASLLFGCAANEVERLRPRALAALDALLGAYCRVYKIKGQERVLASENPNSDISAEIASSGTSEGTNPWASFVSDSNVAGANGESCAIQVDKEGLSRSLLPLLWAASQSNQPKSSRVAAARWAGDLLKHIDVTNASHLLCFLAGDDDVTASSIAREGLGLPGRNAVAVGDEDDSLFDFTSDEQGSFPDFSDYTSVIFPSQKPQESSPTSYWRPQYWDFSFAGKSAALRFGLRCLFNDIYGGDDDAVKVYVAVLADTLVLFCSKALGTSEASKVQGTEAMELLEECSRCLVATLSTSRFARSLLVAYSSGDADVSVSNIDLEYLALSAVSSQARRHLAGACGFLYEDVSLWGKCPSTGETDGEILDLFEWLENSRVHKTLEVCSEKLIDIQRNLFTAGDIHGAAFLGAQCTRAFRLLALRSSAVKSSDNSGDGGGDNSGDDRDSILQSCWRKASSIIQALGTGALHPDEVIANACADGVALALSFDTVDAPVLDRKLYEGTSSALNELAKALQKFSSNDHLDSFRASKLAHAVGKCLAASTSGAGSISETNDVGSAFNLGPARLVCAEALMDLLGSPAFRKDEELALKAGEALAAYCDAYGPDTAIWSSSIAEWPHDFDENIARGLPPHQQVLYTLTEKTFMSNSPHKRTASAPALLAIVAKAARGVNQHESYARRFLVTEIQKNIEKIQNVFISLLSDPKCKQICRESCCLGLAGCRGLTKAIPEPNGEVSGDIGHNFSTEELNHKLLRAFGQTTHFGSSAYQETPAQAAQRRAAQREQTGASVMEPFGEENEVGGASGLSEAGLSSYREMAEAAVALGRIDILYALLILSVSHEAWFTPSNKHKYSASALLGENSIVGERTNTAELRTALKPHLNKLLPRILRACHSPNKATREQFSSLFVGLTGGGSESRAAISRHLLPTIDTLIDDFLGLSGGGKLWRARVGACGALAEILVGRSWSELGGGPAVLGDDDIHAKVPSSRLTAGLRLLRLWRVAMRALDDVRGTVRESGESLARTIRALSVRICNPSLEEASDGQKLTKEQMRIHERDASAAAATTLRWLIKNGLNQQCAEATGICLSTLVAIIDVVRPTILQPLIPDLLRSLLISMSGLEPSALNYLQVRSGSQTADSELSYDNLERARLRLAQGGPIAAAVNKLLDMLPHIKVDIQKEVVPRLDAALRESVGFATRSATADAVSTLCSKCPKAFQFPGSSSTNPSVRLLRALYFASERERGQIARDKMVHALGNLAALCPGSSVRILAMKACEKYNLSTGNNDDPTSRRTSASALRAIAVRASNHLSDGGPKDIWFRRVLPIAYLGKKDSDSKISALWLEVWEEGSVAANLSHGSSKDCFGTIEEKLLPHLVQECSRALEDVSWSRRVTGASALIDLCNADVLSPVPRSLSSSSIESTVSRSERRARASNAALKTCIQLLLRPRLWTGKNEVISATVSIASKWTAAVVEDDANGAILFGWTGKDGACPWQPIAVVPGRFADDLFAGDNWFKENSEVDIQKEEGWTPETEMMDHEGEGKLDFEGCDELSANDEATGSEDEGARVNGQINIPVFLGLCRFFLSQALPSDVSKNHLDSEEFLPYRAAAFKAYRDMMASLSETSMTSIEQKKEVYVVVSRRLISLFDSEGRLSSGNQSRSSEAAAPLLVARAIDCLAASFWDGFGSEADAETIPATNALELARTLLLAGGARQSAWTVREASCQCVASLCYHAHSSVIRSHTFVSAMIECASQAQKDRKFWRVRLAGLKILSILVGRVGNRAIVSTADNLVEQKRQLVLEAVLPRKEEILSLTRSSLTDPEAKVTALGSEIISAMSWWP